LKLFLLSLLGVCLHAQVTDYTLLRIGQGAKVLPVGTGANLLLDSTGIPAGTPGPHLFIKFPTLPPGATSECYAETAYTQNCQVYPAGSNQWRIYNANGVGTPLIRILGLPVGTHAIKLETTAGSVQKSITYNVTIEPVPNPKSNPALARWQQVMLKGAAKFCPTPAFNWGTFSWEGHGWFYDGGRAYLNIYKWTGDERWKECGLNLLNQWTDHIVAYGGKLKGYHVFTRGLLDAYRLTGDEKYRNAIKLLATTGATRSSSLPADMYIREAAFALDSFNDYERSGLGKHPDTERAVDNLINILTRILRDKSYTLHESFFDHLAAHALIDRYELDGDPRIPGVIKMIADWTYDVAWNPATGKLIYNPDPVGPTCANGCQVYYPNLINLATPMYPWLARVLGDQSYAAKGDDMFAKSLIYEPTWSGKEFMQNYRWSFDYVYWRYGIR